MPLQLLDPTLDIIFKLLLLREPSLLRDMVESVLNLPVPIDELEVLNPEIPEDAPGDKSIVLDIRARLTDGRQIDLEMQSATPPGTRARFLYYWARNFIDSIGRGDDYTSLRPCISILWLKVELLQSVHFHSVFHLTEDQCGEVFAQEIEFHVLELPKLHLADLGQQAKLQRWARFLRAKTVSELEELAHEDTAMSTAKRTLEDLSMDPQARRIARDREMSFVAHRHLMAASRQEGREEGRQEGREEGRQEGREEGRQEGLIRAIESMCPALGIELDANRKAFVARLDATQLQSLIERLAIEHQWPHI